MEFATSLVLFKILREGTKPSLRACLQGVNCTAWAMGDVPGTDRPPRRRCQRSALRPAQGTGRQDPGASVRGCSGEAVLLTADRPVVVFSADDWRA